MFLKARKIPSRELWQIQMVQLSDCIGRISVEAEKFSSVVKGIYEK